MSDDYEIPKKLHLYLARFISEYERNEMKKIASVLSGSRHEIVLATSFDNWDGGICGHELIFHVPGDLMANIPLDQQNEISSRIVQDLNKASSSVQQE